MNTRSRVKQYCPIAWCVGIWMVSGTPSYAQSKVWYGLLHAHTYFSDGSGTPEEAYTRAKSKGLHFFAVTPHNHSAAEGLAKERKDGILIANNHALYESGGSVTFQRKGNTVTEKSVIKAAQDANSSSFLALYGQEFSTISSGNHTNVFGLQNVITVGSGDYVPFFQHLRSVESSSGEAPVVQLNHPDIHSDLFYRGNDQKKKNKMFNDYGLDEHGRDFARLVADADRYVVLVELLSGPAMAKTRRENHRYRDHENDYYYYLVQGFHISPSAGHDNHYKTWGDTTDARMGVFADSLTRSDILTAMRENRTFATTDRDIAVRITVNGNSMGSALELAKDTALDIQVKASDSSEPNASYEVDLIYGTVEPQNRESFEKWTARDGLNETRDADSTGLARFEGYVASGDAEFFYARITQSDGDEAWSGPIWINHPRTSGATFVWTRSKGSTIYHDPSCKVAARITPQNLRSGPTPPTGRNKHNCVPADPDESH